MPIVDKVVSRLLNHRIKHDIGDVQDMQQEGAIAILKAIRSPRFEKARCRTAYLTNAVRNELLKSARSSALICVDQRAVYEMRDAEQSGDMSDRSRRVKMAMRLKTLDQMDEIYKVPLEEDRETSFAVSESVQDVCDAVNSLPGPLKIVLGHLYGVAGYKKLLAAEIAERTGVRAETVERRTYDGRRLVKKFLKDRGYGVDTGRQEVSNGDG